MRCVVLVDAGYLLGAAGTLLNKSADRSRLLVDYPELIAAIRSEAELQAGQRRDSQRYMARFLQR